MAALSPRQTKVLVRRLLGGGRLAMPKLCLDEFGTRSDIDITKADVAQHRLQPEIVADGFTGVARRQRQVTEREFRPDLCQRDAVLRPNCGSWSSRDLASTRHRCLGIAECMCAVSCRISPMTSRHVISRWCKGD